MNLKNILSIVIGAILVVALLPVFSEIAGTLPVETPDIVLMLVDTVIPIILVLSVVMTTVEKTNLGGK